KLRVGARAARENVEDPFELPLGAELACVRLDVGDRPANEPRDGNAVPSTRSEVHHRGLEAVARGEPLVLARQDAVVRGDLLACLVALAELLHERLAVGGDGNRVFDTRVGVAYKVIVCVDLWVETD